jgi:hypothetical protein
MRVSWPASTSWWREAPAAPPAGDPVRPDGRRRILPFIGLETPSTPMLRLCNYAVLLQSRSPAAS